jgi:hypothetical protein
MYGCFRGTCCFLLYPDDKGNKFFLNVLSDHTASRPRKELTLAAGRNSNIHIFWKITMLSGKTVKGWVVEVAGRRSGVMWLLLEHPGQIFMPVLVTIPFAN